MAPAETAKERQRADQKHRAELKAGKNRFAKFGPLATTPSPSSLSSLEASASSSSPDAAPSAQDLSLALEAAMKKHIRRLLYDEGMEFEEALQLGGDLATEEVLGRPLS